MNQKYRTLLYAAVALIGSLALGTVFADFMQPQIAFADGGDRINCHNASPIAIYCTDAGVTVYAAGGEFLLSVSQEAIDAVGTPDVNSLVGGVEGELAMYILDTGEYQINFYGAEEMYVAIWTGCHIGAGDIAVYDIDTGKLISEDDGCAADAPSHGTPSNGTVTPTCYQSGSGNQDLSYTGVPNVPNNAIFQTTIDGTCGGPYGAGIDILIEDPSVTDWTSALAFCQAHWPAQGYWGAFYPSGSRYNFALPASVWGCYNY